MMAINSRGSPEEYFIWIHQVTREMIDARIWGWWIINEGFSGEMRMAAEWDFWSDYEQSTET